MTTILAAILVITCLFTFGCALQQAKTFDQIAINHRLHTHKITTPQFTLLSLPNSALSQAKTRTKYINIYLEGDGLPYTQEKAPRLNPSSQNYLALKLMFKDKQPAIYLNRPCYGYQVIPNGCTDQLWTSARYSNTVVNALSQAIDEIKAQYQVSSFNIIGYSGGGSLAVLVASQRKDIANIVTIGANYDHESWTSHFGYPPLSESESALDYLPLKNTRVISLIGLKDSTVPAHTAIKALKKTQNHTLYSYKDFDHQCCWLDIWPEPVESINTKKL